MNACTLQPEPCPDKPVIEDDSTLDFRHLIRQLVEHCQPRTQTALAAELGVSQVSISRRIHGRRKPNLPSVIRLVQRGHIDANRLLLGRH
jgi:antitoxin component HigA of HigAB toxin-antitoxin module